MFYEENETNSYQIRNRVCNGQKIGMTLLAITLIYVNVNSITAKLV